MLLGQNKPTVQNTESQNCIPLFLSSNRASRQLGYSDELYLSSGPKPLTFLLLPCLDKIVTNENLTATIVLYSCIAALAGKSRSLCDDFKF